MVEWEKVLQVETFQIFVNYYFTPDSAHVDFFYAIYFSPSSVQSQVGESIFGVSLLALISITNFTGSEEVLLTDQFSGGRCILQNDTGGGGGGGLGGGSIVGIVAGVIIAALVGSLIAGAAILAIWKQWKPTPDHFPDFIHMDTLQTTGVSPIYQELHSLQSNELYSP